MQEPKLCQNPPSLLRAKQQWKKQAEDTWMRNQTPLTHQQRQAKESGTGQMKDKVTREDGHRHPDPKSPLEAKGNRRKTKPKEAKTTTKLTRQSSDQCRETKHTKGTNPCETKRTRKEESTQRDSHQCSEINEGKQKLRS